MLSIRPLTRGPRLLRGPHRTEIRLIVVDVSDGGVTEECGKVKLRFVDTEDAMNGDYVPLLQDKKRVLINPHFLCFLPVSIG